MDAAGSRRGIGGMDRTLMSSIFVWERPQDAFAVLSGLAAASAGSPGKPLKIGVVDMLAPNVTGADTVTPLSPSGDASTLFDTAHVAAAGQQSCILATSTADGDLVVRAAPSNAATSCVRRFTDRVGAAVKDNRDKASILILAHDGARRFISYEEMMRLTSALGVGTPLSASPSPPDVCLLQLVTKPLARGFAVDVSLEGTRAGHHVVRQLTVAARCTANIVCAVQVVKPRAVPESTSSGALGVFREALRVTCMRLCTTLETAKRCRIARGTFFFGADATDHLWFTSATGITLQLPSPPPLLTAVSQAHLKTLEDTSPDPWSSSAAGVRLGGGDDFSSKLEEPLLDSPLPAGDDSFTIAAEQAMSTTSRKRAASAGGGATGSRPAGIRPPSRDDATLQRSARTLLAGMGAVSGESRPSSRAGNVRSASPQQRTSPRAGGSNAPTSPTNAVPPAAAYDALRAEIARRYQADVEALKTAHRLEIQAQAARHSKEMKDVCSAAQTEVESLRGAADAARAAAADALSAEYGGKMQQLQEELRHMQSAQQSAIMSEVATRDSVIASLRAQVASLSKQASREAAARMEAEQTQEHTTAGAAARVLELETRAAALERSLAEASSLATEAARRATEAAIDEIEQKLRAEYVATVTAAQAAAEVRVSELKQQVDALRSANSELQTAATQSSHDTAAEVARLRQQVQDNAAQLARVRAKQSEEAERLVTAALQSHEAAMEELRARFTADAGQWAVLLSTRESELSAAKLDAAAALAARDQAHSAALNAVRAELLKRHSGELDALKSLHATEAADARRATDEHHNAQMEMLRKEHTAAVAAAVEVCKQDAAAERDRSVREAHAQSHAERKALLGAHDAHLTQLNSMLSSARDTHAADVALLRAQLAASSPTALLSSLQAQVTALQQELQRERQAAEADRAAASSVAQRDAAEVARLSQLVTQREAAFTQHEEATRTAAQSAVEGIVMDLERRMGAEVDAVRAAATMQVEQLTVQLRDAQEALSTAQASFNAVSEAAGHREAALTQQLHDAAATLSRVREQHALDVRRHADASAAEHSQELQAVRAQHASEAAGWASARAELEAALASGKDAASALHSHLQAGAQQSLERQRVDMTTRFQVDMEAQRVAYATELEAQQQAADAARTSAAAAAAAHLAATVQQMQDAHAAQMAQLLNEAAAHAEGVSTAAVQAAQQAAMYDRQTQQAAHDQRVADMRAMFEQQREASAAETTALRALVAKSVPLDTFNQLRAEMESRAMGAVEETVARARDELQLQLQHAAQQVSAADARAAAAAGAYDTYVTDAQAAFAGMRAQLECMCAQREDDAATLRQRTLPSLLQLHAADAYAQAQRTHDASMAQAQQDFQHSLLQTRATADASMRHMQASHDEQVAALQERIASQEAALQRLTSQLTASEATVRATEADADVRIAAARAKADADAQSLEAKLRAAWEEDRRAWEMAAQGALQSAVMETAAAADTAKTAEERLLHAQYQAQLQQMEAAARADLATLRTEMEEKHRASMEAAFSHALADRDSSMRAVLEDKAAALVAKDTERRAAEDALRAAYDAKLTDLRSAMETDRRESQLAAAHALSAQKDAAAAALAAAQAAQREHLNSMHDAALAKLHAEVRATMEAADIAARQAMLEVTQNYERLGMAAEEERTRLLQEHEAALRAAMSAGVNHAQSEAVAALGLLNSEWSAKMTAEMEALRDDYNAMMTAVRSDAQKAQAQAVADAEAAHAQQLAATAAAHAAQLQQLQQEHATVLRTCQEDAASEMQMRLAGAMARAADERTRAVAEAASKAAAERERAVELMRDQANAEHESAMDALRMESDALLGNIEGAMGKLRDERDAARQAAMRMQQRSTAADGVIATLRGRINALLQSGAMHRLQALALAGKYVSLLARSREFDKREHEVRVKEAAGEWGARVGVLEEQLAAERARAKVLLEFRAKLLDTLNGFRRDTVLEHKVRTMELASEIASLADAHADLSKQSNGVAAQLSEMEATVRGVEREMGELAKQGIIGEDGTVNVNLTRRKKRLDRDLDAALARLADRRGALDDVRRRLEACERARSDKEDALRGVEADLIATLVQQQRSLMALMSNLVVPTGADAQLGTLVALPTTLSPTQATVPTFPASPTGTAAPLVGSSKSSPPQLVGGGPSPVNVSESTTPFTVPSIALAVAGASTRPAPRSMPIALESPQGGAPTLLSARVPPAKGSILEQKPSAPGAAPSSTIKQTDAYSRRPKVPMSASTGGKSAAAAGSLPPKPAAPTRSRAAESSTATESGVGTAVRGRAESMSDATPAAMGSRAPAGRAAGRAMEFIGARSMPTSPSGYEPVIEFAETSGVRAGSARGGLRQQGSQASMDEDDLSDDGLIVS